MVASFRLAPPPSGPELMLRSPVPRKPPNLAQVFNLNLLSALHRFFTFPADYFAKVKAEDLAEAGFFMCSSYKCLCCAFCEKEIRHLEGWCGLNQTQMIDEHRRLSPDCPLFRPDAGQNVPLGNPVDFKLEAHRLFSLLRDEKGALWKHVSPYDLARSGFYYAGEQDNVRCEFCRLEVRGWEAGDTALGEHAHGNPDCPLLNNHPHMHNVKLGHEKYCNSSAPAAPWAKFPNLWQLKRRLATFNNAWPKFLCHAQRPRQLAKAGFFYTGMSDRVQCFMCGTELKDWEAGHNSWDRHFGANASCAFLLMTREPSSSIVSSSSRSVASNQQERTEAGTSNNNPSTFRASLPQSFPSRADSEVSSSSEDEPERQRLCCQRCQRSAGAVAPAIAEEVIPDVYRLDAERHIPPPPAEPVPVYEPEDPYPVLMAAGHQRRTSNKVVRGPTGAVPDFQGF